MNSFQSIPRGRLITVSLLTAVWGCDGPPQGLQETRHPTGSQALATSGDFKTLYVANADEGSVARLGADQAFAELELPGAPTRIARIGTRVFVTLRSERRVAVLRDTGSELQEEAEVLVGAEPYGIVASEDGRWLYVASALSGRVDEINALTLDVERSWAVPDEPRWLALHPGGTLYVGSAWQGTLTWIDLDDGEVRSETFPERDAQNFQTGEAFSLARRITGDLAVSPDGQHLVIPGIYLDNQTPIFTGEAPGSDRGGPAATGGGYSQERFTPVVAVVPLSGHGKPHLDDAVLVRIAGFQTSPPVNGYPSHVTVDPTSSLVYAAIEGANALVAFQLTRDEEPRQFFDRLVPQESIDFEFRENHVVVTKAGPRATVFADDNQAFVFGFIDRAVETFDNAAVRNLLTPDMQRPFGSTSSRAAQSRISTARELGPDVEAGRRLFYSTQDPRMSQEGVGVSCALCHMGGRSDGLTWNFDTGPRQTPSLAGQVSLTAPVRWDGQRESVAQDTLTTSRGLMGGAGLRAEDLEAVAAFIDWTADVDSTFKGMPNPAVARGEQLFQRADVGCADCHSGPRFTDNQSYAMFGMPGVQTRSLVGLAGSPPYLHDGSAATLGDLLAQLKDGQMGSTANLTDSELGDLQAYLLSL